MSSPAPGLLDRIRSACAEVTRRARFVRIDDERLAAYGDTLPARAGTPSDHEVAQRDVEATAALVVQLDAINFGSGWHPVLRKSPGRSGARQIEAAYRRHAVAAGVPTAADLTRLAPADCASWLGQDLDGPAGELMALFARSLGELGSRVIEHAGGRFATLVESAAGSAERLAAELGTLPCYRDEPAYDGLPVPLFKRAQITAADLARAFGGRGLGRFHDLDRLTAFADNLVPHVLRVDGVLDVDPVVVRRIERGELLTFGSPEEVELRAVAVEAVERLAATTGVPPWVLDKVLWRRGGEPRYKARPRHRCRTTAY